MRKFLQAIEDYVLLIIAVGVYLIVLALNPELFVSGIRSFSSLFIKVFPIILLVFLLIFITNLLVDEKKITKWFGSSGRWQSWILAIILGIMSAGPIYAWYPLLADLRDKGMDNAYIAVFLYNRAIKPQLLPVMIYYFGAAFVVVLTFGMIGASIINGLIVNKLVEDK